MITKEEYIKKVEREKKSTLTGYRVVTCSSNTNSFGLYRFICVAKTGKAYAFCCNELYKPKKGDDITIRESDKGNFIEIIDKFIELPEVLESAPQEVINEIYKT